MEEIQQTKKRLTLSTRKMFLMSFIFILIVGITILGYLYYQTRKELNFLSSPEGQQKLSQNETSQIIASVSRYIILPDEEPIIATITDADTLISQSAFYKNSQNGDKLLVYQKAKQAFIYSPIRNKLVNVGPILIDGSPVGNNTTDTIQLIEKPSPIPSPSNNTNQ